MENLKVSPRRLMDAYAILNEIIMFGVDITPRLSDETEIQPVIDKFSALPDKGEITHEQFVILAAQLDGILEADEELFNNHVNQVRKNAAAFKQSVNGLFKYLQSTHIPDVDVLLRSITSASEKNTPDGADK